MSSDATDSATVPPVIPKPVPNVYTSSDQSANAPVDGSAPQDGQEAAVPIVDIKLTIPRDSDDFATPDLGQDVPEPIDDDPYSHQFGLHYTPRMDTFFYDKKQHMQGIARFL
jgi:hypothetical protein